VASCTSKAPTCGAFDAGAGPDAADAGDIVASSPPPVDFVDGTRLHAIAYAAPAGGKVFGGWRDTLRNETCRFVRAGDGKLRCLPEHRIAGFFADQGCSTPVLYNSCPTVPEYASVGRDDCGARMFKLTKSRAPLPLFWMKDGMCGGVFPAPNLELWACGPEEPPEAFVAAEEILDPGGTDLTMRRYLAEDGARQVVGPYDRTTKRPCDLVLGTGGLCLPSPTVTTSLQIPLFADAGCTTRVVAVKPGCTADTATSDLVAETTLTERCSTWNYAFHRVGAVVTTRAFYGGPNNCSPIPDNAVGPEVFALLGEPYPLERPPRLKTTDIGSARLRVRYLEDEAGNKLMARGFYDAIAKTTCTPTPIGSDVRCLPDASTAFYGDAACTRAVYASPSQFGCDLTEPVFVTSHDYVMCEAGNVVVNQRYWSVSKSSHDGLVFRRLGDACVVFNEFPTKFRELTEVPLSEAPALSID
jgi:hypothetical protein